MILSEPSLHVLNCLSELPSIDGEFCTMFSQWKKCFHARFLMVLLVDSWIHEFSVAVLVSQLENQPIFRVWVKIGYPNSWMVTFWLFHVAHWEITRFNRLIMIFIMYFYGPFSIAMLNIQRVILNLDLNLWSPQVILTRWLVKNGFPSSWIVRVPYWIVAIP